MVGFNDIADIIWGGEDRMMNVRSNVEERSRDIFPLSKIIAILSIGSVEKDRDKLYYIEHMIVENYNIILFFVYRC